MPPKTQVKDKLLVERFIASFEKLDAMSADDILTPVAWQLAIGDPDKLGRRRWRPARVNTEPSALEPIYTSLPARFPRLFERLVLSYRWGEVDLQICELLPNPPGPDLGGLLGAMSGDRFLWKCLVQAGYIRFARGSGGSYDPVCFDTSARKHNRDYKVVRIDHEQILCYDRIKVVDEVAPSFEALMVRTIERASQS